MGQRFVYVAKLNTGDEVAVRRILERPPDDALAEHGLEEFVSYVGSGYCVLQFALPDGDFQVQFDRLVNDPRVREFHTRLAEHLIEGQQIAEQFAPANRFHAGQATGADIIHSAELPLAAEVSRWP